MTVCIAAISEEDSSIIFVSDKMLSSQLLGGFEMNFNKYLTAGNTILLFAGETTNQTEIESRLKKHIESSKKKTQTLTVEEVVEGVQEIVAQMREELIEEYLERYGLTFEQAKNLIVTQPQNEIHAAILKVLNTVSINSQIIAAGFDKDGKPRIYGLDAVHELVKFNFNDFSGIGMHAIGSGAIQALNALLFARYSKKLSTAKVLYHLYAAKKHAEVAQGVGEDTDMYIFKNDGTLTPITQNDVLKHYEKELKAKERALDTFEEIWNGKKSSK